MNAQEKTDAQYSDLCAQYAHTGFQIDRLVNQRRKTKQEIDALLANASRIIAAEKAALDDAKAPQVPKAVAAQKGRPN